MALFYDIIKLADSVYNADGYNFQLVECSYLKYNNLYVDVHPR